jgi:hypothetical protein
MKMHLPQRSQRKDKINATQENPEKAYLEFRLGFDFSVSSVAKSFLIEA